MGQGTSHWSKSLPKKNVRKYRKYVVKGLTRTAKASVSGTPSRSRAAAKVLATRARHIHAYIARIAFAATAIVGSTGVVACETCRVSNYYIDQAL